MFGFSSLLLPLSFAYASVSVSIQSLSPSTSVNVGTNVSFTVSASGFSSPTYALSDSFANGTASTGDINSSGNFSWTPNNSDVGTHNLTITVSDSQGDTATVEEQITVSAQASLSIQSLSPSSTVTPGQTVTFSAVASGFSGPNYSVSDSFSGSSVTNSDINSSGNFSWTPTTGDVGTHTITINSNDSGGHSASASETIVINASNTSGTVSGTAIQGFTSGNRVIVGTPIAFTVSAPGFTNPVFTIQDPFSGTSVTSSDININTGYFTWTPEQQDVGTHNFNIYVNDNSGHSANIPVAIIVAVPNITVTSITPGTTVTPNNQLSMTVSPAGFTNPTYTLSDSFSGTSITNSNINSSGYFTWTPATNQDGTHPITIYATDSAGHSANTQMTVYVNSGVSVALTAPSPSSSIAPGTTVVFNTYAYGFTNPAYTIQDSLGGSSITTADINSSGAFSWTPTANDAGTHTITVTATDTYSHVGSAQTTITVSGTPVTTTTATQTTTQNSSGYTFSTYLSPGITSSDVTALQNILIKEGYLSAAATGYYGSLTEAAVIAFQAAHGIQQLGVVGPATRAALNSAQGGSTATTTAGDGYVFNNFLDVGSTGTDVTELQQRLTALGMYSGPITGYFGSLTQTAVEQFQGAHGISQVGYIGPATRAALNQ